MKTQEANTMNSLETKNHTITSTRKALNKLTRISSRQILHQLSRKKMDELAVIKTEIKQVNGITKV